MERDDPPRVLFVITALGVGGAETQVLRLTESLRYQGWPVAVVALRELPGLGMEFARAGVPVTTLLRDGERLGPGTVGALVREVRHHRPDCLVTFLLQANVLGRLAGSWCRVPVVSSIRNTRFGGGTRRGEILANALERLTNPLSKAVVVNAALAGEELVRRGVARSATLHVIPNALPSAPATPDATTRSVERAELGIAEDTFLWITVGSLQPQKNHAKLLHAFAALRRERPRTALLIVGEGPLRERLAEAVTEAGLEGAVGLLGLRRDVPRLLALADGFVLSSTHEGLPNVVMEALAAGVPTLSTRVGGVPELIEEGVTGWLAASCLAADLHEAMRALMDRPHDRRQAVAAAGRRRVEERCGLEGVVRAWQAVIGKAIAATGRRR